MAEQREDREKTETKKVEKPTLMERLPELLLKGFVAINFLIMLSGTYVIYKIKFVDKRELITEEQQVTELEHDRELRDNSQIRFTFDPFIVNLDERPRKLVHTTIQLEMLDEDGYVEVVEKSPKARDEIVKIINSKKYTDIETMQGKLFLKDQIMTSMNKILSKGTVKDVYFSEFVVQ
jgi:flagellar FliL protein